MPLIVRSIIKLEMFIWVRESAGLSIEDAAHKMQTTFKRIQEWENGISKPTIKQLRKLGNIYHRPLAVFYLPKPPKDFDAMRDFRRHPGTVGKSISPELRYEIRKASDRRDIAVELLENLEIELPLFTLKADLSDDTEETAMQIRNYLKINTQQQKGWGSGYETLNSYKILFENAGILVFQTSNLNLDDARGFSFHNSYLPAVIINAKDSPNARIFTLFHELAHLTLKLNGICNLEEDNFPNGENTIEIFCNRVAGASLIPKEDLLQENLVKKKSMTDNWDNHELKFLANLYGTSREVVLRRLLILNKTTHEIYEKRKRDFLEEYRSLSKKQKNAIVPPYRKAISQLGNLFSRLVFDNYYHNHITVSDVSDFLGVKLKHFSKIEREVYKPIM